MIFLELLMCITATASIAVAEDVTDYQAFHAQFISTDLLITFIIS